MSSKKRPASPTGLAPNPPPKKVKTEKKKGFRRFMEKVGFGKKDKDKSQSGAAGGVTTTTGPTAPVPSNVKGKGAKTTTATAAGAVSSASGNIPAKLDWPRPSDGGIITSLDKIPLGWMGDDTDVDPDDIDANLRRVNERIEGRIMPNLFKEKLKYWTELRKEADERLRQRPGVTEAVLERIYALENVRVELEECNDPDDQLPNVEAILDAYEKGKLDWTGDGQVTYWSNGYQVGGPGPTPYSDEEFLQLTWKASDEGKPFWVEGFQGVSRADVNVIQTLNPRTTGIQDQNSHWVTFWLRVPTKATKTPTQLTASGRTGFIDGKYAEGGHYAFLDDTGAVFPTIRKQDLQQLINKAGNKEPPTIAWFPMNSAINNEVPVLKLVMLEAAVLGPRVSNPDGSPSEHRLPLSRKVLLPIFESPNKNVSGRWWRDVLYTASAPDSTNKLYIAQTKDQLTGALPKADYLNATLPTTR